MAEKFPFVIGPIGESCEQGNDPGRGRFDHFALLHPRDGSPPQTPGRVFDVMARREHRHPCSFNHEGMA